LHAVEERLEGALEPLGLSLSKLGALSHLAAAGEPLPLGTLAERCACVRSNITQLIDRLEAEKLVVRSDDPRDRRSVRAELTEEGRSRHATGVRALGKAERQLLSHLQQQQRDSLLEALRSLKSGL
jgi:DNA-binding MarR family transcriptional regulator